MKKLEFEKNPQMLCPWCKKPLVPGKPRTFKTLSDHVSDPNNEHSLPKRETFECATEYCILRGKAFWDWYGDSYSNLGYDAYDATLARLGAPYNKCDSFYALNSHSLRNHLDIKADWNGFIVFHLGFWRWKLYIGTQHNLMGEKVALGRIKLVKQKWGRNGWSEGATFWSGIACYFQFLKDIKKIKSGGQPWFGWKEYSDLYPTHEYTWKKEQGSKYETRNGYRLAYWMMNTFHSEWMEAKK